MFTYNCTVNRFCFFLFFFSCVEVLVKYVMASQKQSLSFSTSPCNQDSQNRTVKLSNSSESRSLLTLPSTLEVLGDHLYAKIAYIGESECLVLDVAKLTGILLECGEQEVFSSFDYFT